MKQIRAWHLLKLLRLVCFRTVSIFLGSCILGSAFVCWFCLRVFFSYAGSAIAGAAVDRFLLSRFEPIISLANMAIFSSNVHFDYSIGDSIQCLCQNAGIIRGYFWSSAFCTMSYKEYVCPFNSMVCSTQWFSSKCPQ